MAVDALELRPRNAIALFDAAIRLCATTTGPWALTLPTGALLVAAIFTLGEAIRRNEPLLVPVTLLTAAWLARAVAQGAACHYVEQQVLGTTAPSVRQSLRAALGRAPSLVIAAAWLATLNTVLSVFTLGIGFLFIGAHAAGYAATMRGQGSMLGLYGTCAKLLGPTRFIAPWVRVCGLSQLLLAVNLQLFILFSLSLGRGLFGFDVTFAERFASLDNPTWLASIAAIAFALFEPVRAATATLLLIDGRVRQEGLDLIAQVEQLPRRKKARGVTLAITALTLLFAPAAFAQSALHQRAVELAEACDMRVELAPLEQVPAEDQSSLSRLLSRVERRAFEGEDCDGAEADLREGLRLYAEAREQPTQVDAQAKARQILERPEFQTVLEKPKDDAEATPEAPDEPGWLARLIRRFLQWLEELFKRDEHQERPIEVSTGGRDMAGANAVMIIALVVVAGALLFILLRSLKKKPDEKTDLDETGGLTQQKLEHDAMSALSKPPETWAGLADELAARGEHREAIRHLYLALLSRLHRDGVIDYDPTLSNWEYLFAFKGASSLKAAFKELTRRFDFAWYGNLGVDALAYAMFRRTAEPLLAPTPGAPDRA
ncbi:MAG: DUF4129 domain-containing protein [Myxococcota bacterium]